MVGEGSSVVIDPSHEGVRLTNIVEPCSMLCSLTQQIPEYSVVRPTSDRSHTTMRLEGKMVQPAYDRMMDIFMYATITISGVAIGATILLALCYMRA